MTHAFADPSADGALVELLEKFAGGSRAGARRRDARPLCAAATRRRLSPEAPIPVLRPSARRATLGGAANVALNVATLGAQAALVGVVGDDAAGADLDRLLASSGDRAAPCGRLPGRPTTAKTRFMVGSHQLLRLDEETTDADRRDNRRRTCCGISPTRCRRADVVVLSDYAKGVLSDAVLRRALAQARAAGTHGDRRSEATAISPPIAAPTVLTPNELEVRARHPHRRRRRRSTRDRAGRRALDDAGCEAVLVTRSAKGLTLVRRDLPRVASADPRARGRRRLRRRRHAGRRARGGAGCRRRAAGGGDARQHHRRHLGGQARHRDGQPRRAAGRAAPGRPGGDRPQDRDPRRGACSVPRRGARRGCASASPMAAST